MNGARIKPKAVSYLWPPWIAKGFITIVAGEPGVGKSTIVADVMSRVTTGRPWPGENESDPNLYRKPGQVLWLGNEDPLEELTIPRFLVNGANMENINFIVGSKLQSQARSFSMQDDLGSMMDALDMAIEQGHPIDAMVIDPVTSYLSGGVLKKVDMNDAGQIRTVLEPWSRLASRYNVALVAQTHFAKDTNRSMLNRVLGSGAFSAVARAVIAVTTLPEEAQEGNRWAKAMFMVKCNLPEQPEGAWRFSTRRTTILDEGLPIPVTFADWDKCDSTLTPQNMLSVGNERGPVSRYGVTFSLWFQSYLAANSVPPSHGLPVAQVKAAAIKDGSASSDWWKHHWRKHVEQWDVNGIPYCRPISRLG